MKPLICFYKNDQFIFSEDYQLLRCREDQSVTNFLNAVAIEYELQLKVLQVNFEFENSDLFSRQNSLYPADPATVFVLQKYEILSLADLRARLPAGKTNHHQFLPLENEENFLYKVRKIKTDISEGRIYQVNLTAPLMSSSDQTALDIFSLYFDGFAGDYKALLPLPDYDLISFSPELFLKRECSTLTTQPIKGSLPQNQNFEKNLLGNKKEEAELSMIVDLLRNDFNRIEPKKPALVTKHRAPMKLGYIQHTYSEIQIETQKSLPEILSATAPGGSISGCPKTESLVLISELETYRRQAYTGTLGWWKGTDFCLNLTIRSFMKHQGSVYYHSGCGIVYDSEPEKEWAEFLLKTGSLNVKT